MIKFMNVKAGYENKEVIHGANVTFEPGKITALIGPNGCGKSTLLKTLVRIKEHTAGDILVDGEKVENLSSTKLAQKVAYLPQSKKAPDITVLRMVLHGRFAYLSYPRRYREQDIEIAKKALQWAGMEHKADENVSHLSGGMQQKVYIAMAIAQDTPVILMDEPTSALDPISTSKIEDLAIELKKNYTIVMVTHNMQQAVRVSDRTVFFLLGEVIESGETEKLFSVPQDKRTEDYITGRFG